MKKVSQGPGQCPDIHRAQQRQPTSAGIGHYVTHKERHLAEGLHWSFSQAGQLPAKKRECVRLELGSLLDRPG